MAEDLRRLIADLLGSNLATGLVGVVGVLIGVFAERIAQRYGRVRFEPEPMRLQLFGEQGGRGAIHTLPVDVDKYARGEVQPRTWSGRFEGSLWVEYKVSIELFNEKELRTGLRDMAIVFRGRSGMRLGTVPHNASTWQISGGPALGYGMPEDVEPLRFVNLPSREWVRLDLAGAFNGHFLLNERDVLKLKECETVQFEASFPDRRRFVRSLPLDSEWLPWKSS